MVNDMLGCSAVKMNFVMYEITGEGYISESECMKLVVVIVWSLC